MTWSGIGTVSGEGKGMAFDNGVKIRLVLVTDMLAAAGDELRRVIAELEEMTDGGHGDSGTADRDAPQ